MRIILQAMEPLQGYVLDLGCGEMLLKTFLDLSKVQYTGVDETGFSKEPYFIWSDAIKYLRTEVQPCDFLFCLGVLDHLNKEQSSEMLRLIEISHAGCLIIQQANSSNPFIRNQNKVPLHFNKYSMQQRIYLLKLPMMQSVWSVPDNKWSRWLATECVEIWRKHSLE
ncbi:MAG: hypothetical protein K1X68_13300 [Saprospiraceae bacterium]|nr:hypothetical protein [Saprospiraceae bacterium]HMW39886.1 hypothetical protein [Saprospiraceae bacterium]HMX88282.1 hypothetical protein [Saprospiraceae bacterium]HMZ40434.1 hypothetical protein [Saprospiraceae bacterium]HNA64078.1 hypothetical protein [Saprospiraceae bacterium]